MTSDDANALTETVKAQTNTAVMHPQPVTPLEMLNHAIISGQGVEIIEKLMILQERHEANQGRKAFDRAIADAKAEIPPIIKNRAVDFTGKSGRTNYDYEDLAEIARTVDPILSKNGLSYRFRSRQENGILFVTCVLSHRDGYSEENELSAPYDNSGNKNSIQAIGSAASFLMRYTLRLGLGLATTSDDDGKAADPDEKISEKQLTELIALAEDSGVEKAKFCQWAQVESFADIRRADFFKAKNAILAKQKQAAKKEQADG